MICKCSLVAHKIPNPSKAENMYGSRQIVSLQEFLTLSQSFNLSFTHSRHAEKFLFSCLCSKLTLTLSHSHTLTLSHSHTLSISHSVTLDMLNKFCFHLYAQKSLFIGENCNAFFGPPGPNIGAPIPCMPRSIGMVQPLCLFSQL